ncbi:MAG: DCC1-like thiol-disulfide oxidoreductase family protein [Pseudomonadota bacterium]
MTRPAPRAPYSFRTDPVVPRFAYDAPFAVMDGKCAICSRGARMIHRYDRSGAIRIITAQSALGRALLAHYDCAPDDPDTWLYADHGLAYGSFDAMARMGARCGGWLRLFAIFRLLPCGVQDWLYRRLARNRYALFGQGDLCAIPDPGLRARIIE